MLILFKYSHVKLHAASLITRKQHLVTETIILSLPHCRSEHRASLSKIYSYSSYRSQSHSPVIDSHMYWHFYHALVRFCNKLSPVHIPLTTQTILGMTKKEYDSLYLDFEGTTLFLWSFYQCIFTDNSIHLIMTQTTTTLASHFMISANYSTATNIIHQCSYHFMAGLFLSYETNRHYLLY